MIYKLPKGSRKRLSKNFRAWEFDCHCGRCRETLIDEKLVEGLQKIRDKFNLPVTIVSGYRCKSHNKRVGGVSKSQHLLGRAADIVVYSVSPFVVANQCGHFKGLGRYRTFTHCDVRTGNKARWRNYN